MALLDVKSRRSSQKYLRLIIPCSQIAEAALMILSFRIFNILKSRNKMNSETSDESDDKNYSDVDTFGKFS